MGQSRFYDNSALRVETLMCDLGNKMQNCIQLYNRRPYGVGLIVAGCDDLGPHIYQVCPSANYYECKAMAIGARSQSARTYLEKHLNEFPTNSCDELIRHALRALRDTLPNEIELSTKNVSVSIVGKDQPFTVYNDDNVKPYLDSIESDAREPSTDETATDTAMETMDH